jgi:hypothetical protein
MPICADSDPWQDGRSEFHTIIHKKAEYMAPDIIVQHDSTSFPGHPLDRNEFVSQTNVGRHQGIVVQRQARQNQRLFTLLPLVTTASLDSRTVACAYPTQHAALLIILHRCAYS